MTSRSITQSRRKLFIDPRRKRQFLTPLPLTGVVQEIRLPSLTSTSQRPITSEESSATLRVESSACPRHEWRGSSSRTPVSHRRRAAVRVKRLLWIHHRCRPTKRLTPSSFEASNVATANRTFHRFKSYARWPASSFSMKSSTMTSTYCLTCVLHKQLHLKTKTWSTVHTITENNPSATAFKQTITELDIMNWWIALLLNITVFTLKG